MKVNKMVLDDKKIEEAATVASISDTEKGCVREGYAINALADHENGFREGYIEGAKWAINESLKDLWHPASEEPRKDVSIIVETHNDKNMFYYAWNRWQDNFYPFWTDAVICSRVSRWLYIEDLFPKKGGE